MGQLDRDGPNGLILMYWLDAQGLTEHGGSIYGAWMTDYGKQVLALIDTHSATLDKGETGLVEVDTDPPLDAFLEN